MQILHLRNLKLYLRNRKEKVFPFTSFQQVNWSYGLSHLTPAREAYNDEALRDALELKFFS